MMRVVWVLSMDRMLRGVVGVVGGRLSGGKAGTNGCRCS